MDTREPEDVSYFQMQAAVGSLLFLFGKVEQETRNAIISIGSGKDPKRFRGPSSLLDGWLKLVLQNEHNVALAARLAGQFHAQTQDALRLRNGVCHGFLGASAAYDGKPATLSWELDGRKETWSWEELQRCLSWLARLPRAIDMISQAVSPLGQAKHRAPFPDEDWWAKEYGLDVRATGA